jgi:hypothetical protein
VDASRVTIKELAARWKISRRHIHRLIDSGDLIGIDLTPSGSKKRTAFIFDESEIERFEEKRKTKKVEPMKVERRKRRTEPQGWTNYYP